MASTNTRAPLTRLLTSGIDLMAQMPYVSELLKRVVPSFSLSMIRVDARCAPQQHYSEYFDDFSHDLFASSGHLFAAAGDDPAAFGRLLRAPVPYGNLVRGGAGYESGATYQHLFQRNGIHHCLDVALRDGSGPLGILGIFREKKAPAFTRSDVAMVAELYPALVHALCAEPLPSPHEASDEAILIANEDGVVEWASEPGRAWLEDAIGCSGRTQLHDNRLPEAVRVLARRLQRGEVPAMTLPVPGGQLQLRAYALSALNAGETSSRVAIKVALEMNRRLKIIRALDTAPLTERLRLVALGHADGKTPIQIREELGITRATLKSYQKDLYSRLDVSSSAELVELLNTQAASVTFDLGRHLPRGPKTRVPPTAVGGSRA